MKYLGWLGQEKRWFLPIHQAVEDSDFMPSGWCGGCETCLRYPTSLICGVCSYDPKTGNPSEPIPWPCSVVRETCRCKGRGKVTPTPEEIGKYRPRAHPSAKLRPRVKG